MTQLTRRCGNLGFDCQSLIFNSVVSQGDHNIPRFMFSKKIGGEMNLCFCNSALPHQHITVVNVAEVFI